MSYVIICLWHFYISLTQLFKFLIKRKLWKLSILNSIMKLCTYTKLSLFAVWKPIGKMFWQNVYVSTCILLCNNIFCEFKNQKGYKYIGFHCSFLYSLCHFQVFFFYIGKFQLHSSTIFIHFDLILKYFFILFTKISLFGIIFKKVFYNSYEQDNIWLI